MLATQPTANVTLDLSSSNTSEGTVAPASLTFTTADWNVPQTVTVTGVNDNQSGSVPYQVLFAPGGEHRPQLQRADARPPSRSPTCRTRWRTSRSPTSPFNPSTGLNQGSSLTITWNDTNTGNLPAAAAWDDQVVITNTTTGDTLTTADWSTRTRTWTASRPGRRRLARQYAFTLPTGADGIGNIQITVTANVNHSAFETATSLVNANLRTYSERRRLSRPRRRRSPWAGSTSPWCRTGRRPPAWASCRPTAAAPRSTSRSTSPAGPRSTR